MNLTPELITALTLGLIGGLIPGPVITAIFTEIIRADFKKSLRIIFTALLIESIVAIISLVLFSFANFNESVYRALSFVGAAILIWIAITLWKIRSLDTKNKKIFSLWKITVLILSNGVLWTYWISICIPKAILVKQFIHLGDFLFMSLVQTGWLISTLLLAFVFSKFRSLLSKPQIIPLLFKIFSLIFMYFALDMIIDSLIYFLRL